MANYLPTWRRPPHLQVAAYEESRRDTRLPHLLHTANCSKVSFVMRGVPPRGNHSRFALEIVTVEEREGRKQLESLRSIDDEYTPTIFEVQCRPVVGIVFRYVNSGQQSSS